MCEIEIIDCIQIIRNMCIKRKETTHERVGERKTYINIIEEKISIMYIPKRESSKQLGFFWRLDAVTNS